MLDVGITLGISNMGADGIRLVLMLGAVALAPSVLKKRQPSWGLQCVMRLALADMASDVQTVVMLNLL